VKGADEKIQCEGNADFYTSCALEMERFVRDQKISMRIEVCSEWALFDISAQP
jgi:hypothetical protein